jgi:hypothetical protein
MSPYQTLDPLLRPEVSTLAPCGCPHPRLTTHSVVRAQRSRFSSRVRGRVDMFPRRRAARPRSYGARVKEICVFPRCLWVLSVRYPCCPPMSGQRTGRGMPAEWEIAVVLVPLHVASTFIKMYPGLSCTRAAPRRCHEPCSKEINRLSSPGPPG